MKTIAPFGTWEPIITAEFVAGKDRGLAGQLQSDGADLYFLESRPDEGGRQSLMKLKGQGAVEVLPPDCNVRTRYLEYGGAAYLVHEGTIYFVQFSDQQIYRMRPGHGLEALTRDPQSRFADLQMDAKRNRLLALREQTSGPEHTNTICAVDLTSGAVSTVVAGHDFFHAPRFSPDGNQLLWIQWDHPNMAWNGTKLFRALLNSNGMPAHPRKIAGDIEHGVCQPQWLNAEEISFVAELKEWFQLYRHHVATGKNTNVHPSEAEFAFPDWNPGQKEYAAIGDTICASFFENGQGRMLLSHAGKTEVLPLTFSDVMIMTATTEAFYAIVDFPDKAPALVRIGLDGKYEEVYRSYQLRLSPEEISLPVATTFPTAEGGPGHAWFYAPTNARFQAPSEEKPPLIVICHGGPTAASPGAFKKSTQFWTNRGYAVVDVNYGGSSGFGRAYRERLRGRWGIVDVSDCEQVVKHLAAADKIDPKRVVIRGGSAGGYTVLAALAFTKGIFSGGASLYGVSDLELLAKETHKLEARYMDQLVGPYPQAKAIYQERSPIAHVEQLNCPIVFFQGEEDKVVPPNQSEILYEALKKKGIYTEFHLYPGEGHGFRKAETVQHSLKSEHHFYGRLMGFEPVAADQI